MCGIAGFFARRTFGSSDDLAAITKKMTDVIEHRGPDDSGAFVDVHAGLGLGFRRLAILDLSPNGHQPMESHSGRYVMTYNGEVYNYRRIQEQLSAEGKLPPLRGTSDTETMLAAIEAWGFEKAVKSFIGFFAIALWDRERHELTLCRDRVGVKPLYVAEFGKSILYGSELKSFRVHPEFKADVNRDALAGFLRFGYVPSPHSIYQNTRKLKSGSFITYPMDGEPTVTQYWSPEDVVAQGLGNPLTGTDDEIAADLERLLTDAIGLRMISDVPIGAFLSGGVDSSLVVALMQAQSSQPVRTFTIGFDDANFNEAVYAKDVAAHLGTQHTELYVTGKEALDVVPQLATMFDEPFADSSQIPTYLVSKMAREHVTVSLSGDGGDELFCGYNRYSIASKIWQRYASLPRFGQRALVKSLEAVPPRAWEAGYALATMHVSKSKKFGNVGDKVTRLSEALKAESPMALYTNLLSQWKNPNDVVIGGREPETILDRMGLPSNRDQFLQFMMQCDMDMYLQEDIMTKVDRASMAVSLESREPLLDHRIIEFAWRLPPHLRGAAPRTKHMLRSVLYKHVPQELIERPKQGFAVPMGQWLRGPLRDWAEALLDESRLKQEGYFHPELIRKRWNEHVAGKRNWHYYLWVILMFQAWHEAWMDSPKD